MSSYDVTKAVGLGVDHYRAAAEFVDSAASLGYRDLCRCVLEMLGRLRGTERAIMVTEMLTAVVYVHGWNGTSMQHLYGAMLAGKGFTEEDIGDIFPSFQTPESLFAFNDENELYATLLATFEAVVIAALEFGPPGEIVSKEWPGLPGGFQIPQVSTIEEFGKKVFDTVKQRLGVDVEAEMNKAGESSGGEAATS